MMEPDVGRISKDDARREVHAPDLLGRSNSDNRLPTESDIFLRDKGVAARTVHRAEPKLGTPSGVQ